MSLMSLNLRVRSTRWAREKNSSPFRDVIWFILRSLSSGRKDGESKINLGGVSLLQTSWNLTWISNIPFQKRVWNITVIGSIAFAVYVQWAPCMARREAIANRYCPGPCPWPAGKICRNTGRPADNWIQNIIVEIIPRKVSFQFLFFWGEFFRYFIVYTVVFIPLYILGLHKGYTTFIGHNYEVLEAGNLGKCCVWFTM